ncbi:MAG: 2-oxoacid:ferredoxin oxidoreductase subunit beta [Proteobacteria bacterium]|nr:2-oxoacid:ferredoxin oxidoreductase subunit beta [Pseudomonadota bacterium]
MDHIERFYIDEKLADIKKDGFLNYRSKELPTWCPGCGYFGITQAIAKACNALSLPNENICVVSGIGCAGRYPIFMKAYGFHTLHGRSVPIASGIKLANEDLTVFAVGGDGDMLGIGGGHLPHIARKNIDITLFLFDNMIYGLTKGQSSATTPLGQKTNSHTKGNPDSPLKPISLALAYDASFVARGFAGDLDGMQDIFMKAIRHKGFSFVHLITPCVTFDKVNTWDVMRNGYHPIHESHDVTDRIAAMRLAEDQRFFLGVFYQDEKRPSYQEYLRQIHSA